MIVRPLTTNERAETPGYTHVANVTADDLTTTTANTAQTLTIATLATTDIIGRVQDYVKTSFQSSSDAAFNTTTRSLGDNTGVATHTAAAETNTNGTVVLSKFSNTAVGPYTAANTLTVTFNAMAGKNLNAINRGELIVLFQLIRIRPVVEAVAATGVTKA